MLRKLAATQLLRLPQPLVPTAAPAILVENAEALSYLSGIWLEEYVWLCMLEAGLDDVRCSQKISDSLGEPEETRLNELDVIVGHCNRMLVVECKTADLTRKGAGGLLTQYWLVAVRWPQHSEAQQLLARSRNIVLVEPRHLANLPQRISRWKTSLKLSLN